MGGDVVLGLGRLLAVPGTNAFPIGGQRGPSAARTPHPLLRSVATLGRLDCPVTWSQVPVDANAAMGAVGSATRHPCCGLEWRLRGGACPGLRVPTPSSP